MKRQPTPEQTQVWMDLDLVDKLREKASQEERPLIAVVRRIVRLGLNQEEKLQ